MLSKLIPGHLAFLATTVLLIILAAYLFLMWHRRWMVRNSIDPTGRAAGVYAAAWVVAFCAIIAPTWDPLRLIFERMSTMALSVWETVQYMAFQITMPTLLWFLLMRLITFVFTWVNGMPSVAMALKEEQHGRVLPIAAVMVMTSWLLGQSIAPLAASFLPYPEIPLFK
jgi:hypothetical protein